jgi:hypothetical protein
MAEMIEEDDLEGVLKLGGNEPPHVLVTAVTVKKDDGLRPLPRHIDVVSLEDRHHVSCLEHSEKEASLRSSLPASFDCG